MNIPGIPIGKLRPEDDDLLYKYSNGKELAIDLGVFMGRSSWIMSFRAKRIIAIDIFEDLHLIKNEEMRERFRKLYNQNPHSYFQIKGYLSTRGNIEVLKGESDVIASSFLGNPDFLFIDADHTYEGVKRDFEAWFPKMKVGGIIIFHDSGPDSEWRGILRYIEENIKNNPEICFKEASGACTVWEKLSFSL